MGTMSEMVDQQNRKTTSFQAPVLCEKNTSAVQLANQNTRFIQVTIMLSLLGACCRFCKHGGTACETKAKTLFW